MCQSQVTEKIFDQMGYHNRFKIAQDVEQNTLSNRLHF